MRALPRPALPFRLRVALQRRAEGDDRLRRVRDAVAALVGDGRVLEIGSGLGFNAPRCDDGYTGVDLDPRAVEEARRTHPRRDFVIWDVIRDGAPPGEYDTALLCLVLHEADDRPALLDAFAALPVRRLAVVDYDPAMGGWDRLREGVAEKGRLRGYRRVDLAGSLARHGWRQVAGGSVDRLLRHWTFERG